MIEIKSLQDDTLELIAWREYGAVFGFVEELMKLNPHLLHLKTIPLGSSVFLPDKTPQKTSKAKRFGDV